MLYQTIKTVLKKNFYEIYYSHNKYGLKLQTAYCLLTDMYFEFYSDTCCTKLMFKLSRSEVSINIKKRPADLNSNKKIKEKVPEIPTSTDQRHRKTTVKKLRGRFMTNLTDSELQEVPEENSNSDKSDSGDLTPTRKALLKGKVDINKKRGSVMVDNLQPIKLAPNSELLLAKKNSYSNFKDNSFEGKQDNQQDMMENIVF